LLHHAFSKFLDDCETLETTMADNSLTEELHVAMSKVYKKERPWAEAIREILKERNLAFIITHIGPDYKTDGDMSVSVYR